MGSGSGDFRIRRSGATKIYDEFCEYRKTHPLIPKIIPATLQNTHLRHTVMTQNWRKFRGNTYRASPRGIYRYVRRSNIRLPKSFRSACADVVVHEHRNFVGGQKKRNIRADHFQRKLAVYGGMEVGKPALRLLSIAPTTREHSQDPFEICSLTSFEH